MENEVDNVNNTEKPFDINSASQVSELVSIIFPFYRSDEALRNRNFKKAYKLSQKLLDSYNSKEVLNGSIIYRIFNLYTRAADESGEPEAYANVVWIIFIWWTQIGDTNQMLSLQDKQSSHQLSIDDLSNMVNTSSKEIQEKKDSFINDFEPVIDQILRALKVDSGWTMFSDYYQALKNIVGLTHSDLSPEMTVQKGLDMMISFGKVNNSLASDFCHAFNL